jgi:hypothetical protein
VAHWTFDNAHVSGSTVLDIANDAGYGKGGHNATQNGGTRPGTGLAGAPGGGLSGNYFDANGDGYASVDNFDGAAAQGDLEASDQFTIAGWFRELPDGSDDPWVSKNGGTAGWALRRNGSASSAVFDMYGTDGSDSSPALGVTSLVDGGPWYFMAATYRKFSESHSALRFYAADSGAADKSIAQVGAEIVHSPDNDTSASASMLVFGAADAPGIGSHSSAKMDDIAIWNRGLTPGEIAAWYGMSYFSGIKATDAGITTLLDGPVGTVVTDMGPHQHTWLKLSNAGTVGDISGSLAAGDAAVQITSTEWLRGLLPPTGSMFLLR